MIDLKINRPAESHEIHDTSVQKSPSLLPWLSPFFYIFFSAMRCYQLGSAAFLLVDEETNATQEKQHQHGRKNEHPGTCQSQDSQVDQRLERFSK